MKRTYIGYVKKISFPPSWKRYLTLLLQWLSGLHLVPSWSLVGTISSHHILNPALKLLVLTKSLVSWNSCCHGSFSERSNQLHRRGDWVLFFIVKAAEKAQNLGKKKKCWKKEAVALLKKSCLLKSATCLQTSNQIKIDLLVRRSVFCARWMRKTKNGAEVCFCIQLNFYVWAAYDLRLRFTEKFS